MSRVKDVVLFCINACSKLEFIKTIKNNIKIHIQGSVAWPLENDKLACVALAKRPFYTFIFSPSELAHSPLSVEALQRALDSDASAARKHHRKTPLQFCLLSPLTGNHSVLWMTFNSAACLLFTFNGVKWIWRGATLHLRLSKSEFDIWMSVLIIESKARENTIRKYLQTYLGWY